MNVQQTLHDLTRRLQQAHDDVQDGPAPSPFPDSPPPSRADVHAAVADVRRALEAFVPVWSAGDDEARVKASGAMREWATNASVLSTLPSLPSITSSQPTSSIPFALPPSTPLPTLLEIRSKRLGLEVYRETLLDDDDAGSSASKELLVLGGKVLVLELELAPIPTTSSSEETGWELKKFTASLSIPGATDPHPAPALDAFLQPPLVHLLHLLTHRPHSSLPGRETPELVIARQLAEFKRRLEQALAFEHVFGLRPGVFDEMASLRSTLTPAASMAEEAPTATTTGLFPSVEFGLGRTLTLVPTAGPSRARRLAFLSTDEPTPPPPTATPFRWEATFDPPLFAPVALPLTAQPPLVTLKGRVDSLPQKGFWTPPEGRGEPQAWSLDSGLTVDWVPVSRVGLEREGDVRPVVDWARKTLAIRQFCEKALEGTTFPFSPVQPPTDAFLPDAPVPVSVSLSTDPSTPSLTLTFPSPSTTLPLSLTLTPAVVDSAQVTWEITLPAEVEALLGRERVRTLGEKVGGEGRGVVLWFRNELGKVAEGKREDERAMKRVKLN